MDNKMTNNNDEIEIDLKRLGTVLLRKAWVIGLVAAVCAVSVFLGTFLFVTPQYTSTAMIYVNNSSAVGEVSSSITSSDISASRGLVKSYLAILNTKETMELVAEHAGVDLTYTQVQAMITAGAVDSTEIIEVMVTSEDPVLSQSIADAVTVVLPERISGIIDGTSAKTVASANLPKRPSSPDLLRNTIIGFLVGFVMMAAVIVLRAVLDVSIHTEEDIQQLCDYPILAIVPDMMEDGGSKYLSKAAKNQSNGMYASKDTKSQQLIGEGIGFLAAEAYKLLRTKLQFSFADEKESHVIGICSALSGEGKSLTAINLAHSVSQLGKRVLLIDCDMRRPSIAKKLRISNGAGLSDYLAGHSYLEELVQVYGTKVANQEIHVIAAGRIPPNPVELLSSARMRRLLEVLQTEYEYVILDLPPVVEVSDAMAVAAQTDGVILVVRQNYCDQNALRDTTKQFEFVDSRILGVVFNHVEEEGRPSARNYKGNAYRRSYEAAMNRAFYKNRK